MQVLLTVNLPPDPSAPRSAREAIRKLPLSEEPSYSALDLLVSELVSNSVRHADLHDPDQIKLVVQDQDTFVRVEIQDPGNGYSEASAAFNRAHDRSLHPELTRKEDSYGFFVIDRLANRAGVTRDGGTMVWFEIDR